MDQIKIENLEIFANHGVYPEENRLGQKFLVSCILYVDTRKAGKTDDLEASVNYGTISHLIKEKMEEKNYRLIEAVAEQLAEEILLFDEKIRKVMVEVKKPWAPVGLPLETVSVKIERCWNEAFIALGSNMGDKKKYIENAVEELKNEKLCRVLKVSKLIGTEPYGVTNQDEFLNGALKMETLLTPHELLELLHRIEQEAGRKRIRRWGPRTLDLDIIFYGDQIIEEDDLCIPHIDMQNREFVLGPMCEIAPHKRHPVLKETMTEMLVKLKGNN